MADPKQVAAPNGIGNIAQLLQLAGGGKGTSTTTSDTSALQDVLGQLKGQDPAKLLETIFTKASGEIPGLQAAMSNAVGARSGGNSAVSAILQKLLQQTTLLGQQQLVDQQQKNLATQGQVADAIARGNTKTTKTEGTNLGKAAQTLAMLSAGQKLLDPSIATKAKDLFSSAGNFLTESFAPVASAAPALSAAMPAFSAPVSSSSVDFSPLLSPGTGWLEDIGGSFSNLFGSGPSNIDAVAGVDASEPIVEAGGDWLSSITDWFGFADGGLVKSQGGRRSSAPSFKLPTVKGTLANNAIPAMVAPPVSGKTGKADESFVDGSSPAEAGLAGPASQALGKGAALSIAANALMGNIPGAIMGMISAAHPMAALGMKGVSVAMNPSPQNIAMALLGLLSSQGTAASNNEAFGLSSASENTGFGENSGGQAGDTGYGLGGTNASLGDAGNTGFSGGVGIGMGNAGGIGAGIGDSIGETGIGESGFGESVGDAASEGIGGGGMKSGGEVDGPGTGTSDSIPILVSDGEYVIPADVVEKLGVTFFDELRNRYHDK